MYQVKTGYSHQISIPNDTGFIEAAGPSGSEVHLRLTAGSAREYLIEYEAIEKQLKPRFVFPIASLILSLTAFLVAVGAPLIDPSLGSTPIVWTHGAGAFFLWGEALTVGALIVTGIVSMVREAMRETEQSALAENAGVSASISTGLSTFPAPITAVDAREFAREFSGITPEVRDRLMGLLRAGKTEAAREAVRLLVDEAPRRSGMSRREEREAVAAEAARAIGR